MESWTLIMFKKSWTLLLFTFLLLFLAACGNGSTEKASAKKEPTELILATTTSTQDSGLLDVLLPLFEKKENVKVKPIAVGTGEALEMGKKGEADVLLVHAPDAEMALVDSGDVINRKRVMYNDFIVVGPAEDPATLKGLPTQEAFKRLFEKKALFISRGDDSGTHKKELAIWKALNLSPAGQDYYKETGQGMGATLQVASEKKAYVLTDRATYLAQQKKAPGLEIIVEGDKDLLNIYHVMTVNPEKHKGVNDKDADAFVDFMIDAETQNVIEAFGKKEYGQSLFNKYTE